MGQDNDMIDIANNIDDTTGELLDTVDVDLPTRLEFNHIQKIMIGDRKDEMIRSDYAHWVISCLYGYYLRLLERYVNGR